MRGSAPTTWRAAFSPLISLCRYTRRTVVLVVDDAHRLAESRAKHLDAVASVIDAARRGEAPLHIVLVGPEAALPGTDDLPEGSPEPIRCGPLAFRAALPLLPGSRPADLLRAYGVFGGIPRVLANLDPAVALGTNLRRAALLPESNLFDFGGSWLERDVQRPGRYYAILSTLVRGEAEWAALHRAVPDLAQSGQIAPYVKRLEELGLVAARRSLDAPANSRARRYTLTDPFIGTWLRLVFDAARRERPSDAERYTTVTRAELDEHVTTAFPKICRQYMVSDAIELLGQSAREHGSLWSSGYDIPVAGILSGGSPFYGRCAWTEPGDEELDRLDEEIRRTRYGYGREHRLRILFTAGTASPSLQREVARRHEAWLVDADALVGN